MNHSQFSDGPYAGHPYEAHPSDTYSNDVHQNAAHPIADAPVAEERVDWPETREIRALLRCGDANCLCHREGRNVHCPAHDDKNPSLSVNDGTNASQPGAKSIWHCYGGCPQKSVSKALYERVFGNSIPINAATSPGVDAAKSAASKTCRTLRQRGIGVETRRRFKLEEYAGAGVLYPSFEAHDVAGPKRFKSSISDSPKYRWVNEKSSSENEGEHAKTLLPTIYNADVIGDLKRMEAGFYIAKSESDVWILHQCGVAAICSLAADRDPKPLVQFLRDNGIKNVEAIYGNDLAGRQNAVRLRDACDATNTKDSKVASPIRLIGGGLGFDLSDLFAQVKFDAKKFREELEQLPFVPHSLLNAWRQNPEVGLPDPVPETATEGTGESTNAANIGADGLFECLDEVALDALPLPEYVVEGLVLEGRPTILFGQFGTGKSLIALDMALCISQNRDWCGRQTKPDMAFFVAGEGASGLKKRLAAWKEHYGVESTPLFRVIRHPVILSEPEQCQSLIKTIRHHTGATSTPAALVVIDTLALAIGDGTDENSSVEMTRFLKAAETICLATGAAVLILHHPNRQGGARGSSALPGNSDGFLSLDGETSSEFVKLRPVKVRDMGEGGGMKLRRVVVPLDAMLDSKGKPVTSAVFVPVLKGEGSEEDFPEGAPRARAKPFAKSKAGSKTAKSRGELSEKEEATWQALLTLNANGAEGGTAKEWRAHAATHGVSDSAFDRAKNKLQELGKVDCDAPGKLGARFTPIL